MPVQPGIVYGAFVVRCWYSAGRVLRVDVEHVQSRTTVRLASLVEAERWMAERMDQQAGGGTDAVAPSTPEPAVLGDALPLPGEQEPGSAPSAVGAEPASHSQIGLDHA